ncbi:MAG: hypothetical protein ACPG21_03570 [Crocinitomicaceae bacterium]
MEKAGIKRPTTLKVLLILSAISLAFQLIVQVMNTINGPLNEEQMREQKIEMMAGFTEESAELMQGTMTEMLALADIGNENFYLISAISLMTIAIGLASLWLMFQMRRIGFHLYVIYSLIPIADTIYFFGGMQITTMLIVLFAIVGGVFSILYGMQLKHMR